MLVCNEDQVTKSVVAWSTYFCPAVPSSQRSKFPPATAPARSTGAVPGETTKRVMLWGGSVLVMVVPVKLKAPRFEMVLTAVNCQSCPVPLGRKLFTLTETAAAVESCLLITMRVSAPSAERVAAKADTLSGLGTAAATLTSPKADLLPS